VRNRWPEWVAIPYLLFADILNTAISAFFVFSGRLLYPTYGRIHAGGMSPQDDQILAGAVMWVPGSIVYLLPAIVFAMRLLSGARPERKGVKRVHSAERRSPARHSRLPLIRRGAQIAMLVVALAVMADGFFGPQVAPLNAAGILPWIHWRALSIFALLAVGNLFCMACPFTFVRDIARKVLPAKRRWPRKLRTKWLAAGLLVLYLWSYEAFGLWNSPWLTAWIIAAYFTTALAIDGVFRGASFCKYICPIGQFHFVSSLVSPREIRVRSAETCRTCRTHDCIRGNESTRGCELFLFQPKKAGNLDCTFCLDCVKACPHDNVAVLPVAPASTLLNDPYRSSIGRLSKRTDLAALALLIVFGAFVNAAGMVEPSMAWLHSLHAKFGPHTMSLIVAGFIAVGVIVVPATAVFVCGALNRFVTSESKTWNIPRRFVFTLVPVGVAMWAAHLLYHFATGWNAPLIILHRPLSAGVSAFPSPFLPEWLTPAQILFLDAGLLLSLYVAWRVARQYENRVRSAVALAAPWAALSSALYGAGIWILLQPMQMRGMLH
jgi:ferredoxin